MKITKQYLTKLIRESIEEMEEKDVDDVMGMFGNSEPKEKPVFNKEKFIKAIENLSGEVYADKNFRMNKRAADLLAYIYEDAWNIPTKK